VGEGAGFTPDPDHVNEQHGSLMSLQSCEPGHSNKHFETPLEKKKYVFCLILRVFATFFASLWSASVTRDIHENIRGFGGP
jgi:hypothetical protein